MVRICRCKIIHNQNLAITVGHGKYSFSVLIPGRQLEGGRGWALNSGNKTCVVNNTLLIANRWLFGTEWTWNSCKYLFHFSSDYHSTQLNGMIKQIHMFTKLVSLHRHLWHRRLIWNTNCLHWSVLVESKYNSSRIPFIIKAWNASQFKNELWHGKE